MIVGLSGWAGAGKDSVGKVLVEDFGFRRVAFADKLRDIAVEVNPYVDVGWPTPVRLSTIVESQGWDYAKKHKDVREFLQRLGASIRALDPEFWIHTAGPAIFGSESVVITDVRYENEAEAIVNTGGLVLRIDRPGNEPANDHESEHDLDDWMFDQIIVNDGTLDDLRRQVHVVAKHLLKLQPVG